MQISGMTHGTVLITLIMETATLSKWLLEYSKIFDNAATAKPYFLALTKCHFLMHSNDLLQE
jgi:hypothetical protein